LLSPLSGGAVWKPAWLLEIEIEIEIEIGIGIGIGIDFDTDTDFDFDSDFELGVDSRRCKGVETNLMVPHRDSTLWASMTVRTSPSPISDSRDILRRVLGGTSLLVVGRVWSSLCTVVTLWLLAGHLSGDAFGRYTFYLAVFMLLDSLVDLGTGSIAVQRTADDEEAVPAMLGATRRIRLVAALSGVLLVGGGAFALGERGAIWILIASFYPLTHVLELSATVFRNRIAWGVPVAIRAGGAAFSLAFVGVGLALEVTEPGVYVCAVALGSALANLGLHVAARPHLAVPGRVDFDWRAVLASALPLGLAGLCQQAYFYVDNVFVRALRGSTELGHYNVGVRIMSLCIMVAVYASLVALPWFRREHSSGTLGAAVARLAQPLFTLAGLVTGVLLPWSGEILVLAIAAPGLAVNLGGNAALVPTLGIDGAAISTFATEAAVALGALIALLRSGVRGLGGKGAWRWLGGPVGFAVGWLASGALASLLGGG